MYLTMYKGYKIIQEIFTYKVMWERVTVEKGFSSIEDAKNAIDNYK